MYESNIKISNYEFSGGAKRLIENTDEEVILIGQYQAGKSLALAAKAHYLCESKPGIRCALVADTKMAIKTAVFPIYKHLILKDKLDHLKRYGHSDCPKYIEYPNKSMLYMFSNGDPLMLASHFDFMAVFNAENFSSQDWTLMLSRTIRSETYGQIAGDVSLPHDNGNKDFAQHIKIPDWILYRNSITILRQHPKDNPLIYDDTTQELTPSGEQLSKLYSGMPKKLTSSMAYFN